ncbi:unnamed protein product [Thlaspi arvense]|uniref:RGS domain-containing protein n=1 Tax=Thlaspi arvense TaxID=13288 RepID=A0AAU9RGT6_THLAR|nr:unnamed protein product [Thlaspi arvense]
MKLLTWSTLPFLIHKVPRPKGSSFWLPALQVFASFNLLLSIVVGYTYSDMPQQYLLMIDADVCQFLEIQKKALVAVLLYLGRTEGYNYDYRKSTLTNFETLVFSQYYRRHLPPIRTYVIAACNNVVHTRKPLNYRCHMQTQWTIPVVCFHALYVAALVGYTGAIRHVEFRFHELNDLWRGIIVSTSSIGIWVIAYLFNEIHEEIEWLQVASRFCLLTMASIFLLAFFSISSSQPLISQLSLRKKDDREFESMGQALGIPDSGPLLQRELPPVIDPNEPLDKLLLDKRFRQSFMAFADSCLAGESVHFYDEVHERNKIPVDDTVRRIYMARHIIEKYIVAGSTMEVNISHRNRQEILTTANLAHPALFKNALNELLQLMKMNLAKDYWSSMYFVRFQEEASMRTTGHELEQVAAWNFSPRLSAVHGVDDPFHQEHHSKDSGLGSHDLDRP